MLDTVANDGTIPGGNSYQSPAMNQITSKELEKDEKVTKSIILLAFVSALGGFLFGYDTGVVSGAMILVRKEFELSSLWQELIISVTVAAAWLFSLIAGPLTDYFGRRKVIILSSVVFTVGSLVMAFSSNKELLLVGRMIVGIAIGLSSMCIPVYLSELSPMHVRGRLTVINTVFITGGQFVASVVAGLFATVTEGWRWMFGIGCLPSVIQFFCFFFTPESPRWLSSQGKVNEARKVLMKYRSNVATAELELENYSKSDIQTSDIRGLVQVAPVRRALILGCLLQLFQQISGINTVMYYSASIIAMAGVSDDVTAIWLSAVTSFFNFSFTFVGLWLVERVGRRPLTLWSLAGVSVALLSLALSFQLVYVNSPEITSHSLGQCSQYRYCSLCTEDPNCGFCFYRHEGQLTNSSCLVSSHSSYNEVSEFGDCSEAHYTDGPVFAYNWCPSQYAWLSVLGLCVYLCFFAPGMGPMPWSINSEIYPNWARAKASGVATSVNWSANLLISLTFLSLIEAITKHGTFYLYMCFSVSGLITFFFILPETQSIPLEEVEHIFKKPLHKLRPWSKR